MRDKSKNTKNDPLNENPLFGESVQNNHKNFESSIFNGKSTQNKKEIPDQCIIQDTQLNKVSFGHDDQISQK